jgi:hypothetical protein
LNLFICQYTIDASRPGDFCAVELEVVYTDDGQPVVEAVVELIDSGGRVIRTQRVVNGRTSLCDFGFGDYSILVHDERSQCAATEIKKVHVIYGVTQKFKVALNFCMDEGDVFGNACGTYVRVATPDGRPLKGVQISYDKKEMKEITDSYGRGTLTVREGMKQSFTFSLPGYKSQTRVLECRHPLQGTDRLSVVLRPKKGSK